MIYQMIDVALLVMQYLIECKYFSYFIGRNL